MMRNFASRDAGAVRMMPLQLYFAAVDFGLSFVDLAFVDRANWVRGCQRAALSGAVQVADQSATIHGLIEAQAQLTPDAIAIIAAARQMSYAELNRRANALAQRLRMLEISRGQIVAVIPGRSAEMLIGILAVLKAGAAYLPVDHHHPPSRITQMLRHARVDCVLSQRPYLDDIAEFHPVRVVIDIDDETSGQPESGNPVPVNELHDPAYVIFTSGSTGTPKGVVVGHAQLINLLVDLRVRLQFDERRTVLALTTLAFDIFVVETLIPFACGACVVVATEAEQMDGVLIAELVVKWRVDFLQMTPSRLKSLLQTNPGHHFLNSVRDMVLGGEVLPQNLLDKLAGLDCRVHNLYGPTETTVYCTGTIVHPGLPVTIGRAIACNSAYIVDERNQPLLPGETGELLIGGPGVALGYLHDAEQTAARFINGLVRPGERVYRTGDLARWSSTGEIEFLGRRDRQVKVRGFRIELDEIENRLAEIDGIEDVAVEAFADSGGDQYLCAYYVAAREYAPGSLRQCIVNHLPEYMVPSYFIRIAKMPLTPNNKIDRKALPPPVRTARTTMELPGNDLEEQLRALWSIQLRIDPDYLSIDDAFLDVGGNSLHASSLAARIHELLGVRVPMAHFFQGATIRELARYVEGQPRQPFVTIKRAADQQGYPMTPAQQGLFYLEMLAEACTAYNLPDIYLLESSVDKDRLSVVFAQLVQRHESFRTSFSIQGDTFVQKIHHSVSFELEVCQAAREEADQAVADFIRPFDLNQPPLFRARITELRSGGCLLMIDMHHIIADGYSLDILAREFNELMAGRILPVPRLRFVDYAVARESLVLADVDKAREFWARTFQDSAGPLRLPTDFPRPPFPSFRGERIPFVMNHSTAAQLKSLIRDERSSLFAGLLTVANVFVAGITHQDDIVIGTPVAGRGHVDLDEIVGMFVNTLPVRIKIDRKLSFRELLHHVSSVMVESLDHQAYPFDHIVRDLLVSRDPGRNPMFDVLFVFQDADTEALQIPGAQMKRYPWKCQSSKIDLLIHLCDSTQGLECYLEYDTSLFRRTTIQRMCDVFLRLTQAIVDGSREPISGYLSRITSAEGEPQV